MIGQSPGHSLSRAIILLCQFFLSFLTSGL